MPKKPTTDNINIYRKGTDMENSNSKITDKLTKVNESFTVHMYDNGYMFEIGGVDDNDDWKNCKILCNSIEALVQLVHEASEMERRD